MPYFLSAKDYPSTTTVNIRINKQLHNDPSLNLMIMYVELVDDRDKYVLDDSSESVGVFANAYDN